MSFKMGKICYSSIWEAKARGVVRSLRPLWFTRKPWARMRSSPVKPNQKSYLGMMSTSGNGQERGERGGSSNG